MEAYRVLGSHLVDLVCAGCRVPGAEPEELDLQLNLPKLFAQAEAYLEAYAQKK